MPHQLLDLIEGSMKIGTHVGKEASWGPPIQAHFVPRLAYHD